MALFVMKVTTKKERNMECKTVLLDNDKLDENNKHIEIEQRKKASPIRFISNVKTPEKIEDWF